MTKVSDLDFIRNPRLARPWSLGSNAEDARRASKAALAADGLPPVLSAASVELVTFSAPRGTAGPVRAKAKPKHTGKPKTTIKN